MCKVRTGGKGVTSGLYVHTHIISFHDFVLWYLVLFVEI